MSGISGISGPPVILTYMSSLKPASVIRGNTMLYLFFVDLVMFGVFLLKGLLVFYTFSNRFVLICSVYIRWISWAKKFSTQIKK